MNILFITAEGFDTPNPNNQMAEVMIQGFLDHGHSVHLIQSHRKGINPDIPISLKHYRSLTSNTINRKIVNKTNFISRYLNDVHYAFQALKYWKKIQDIDIIYLQSNPTIIFPMLLLRLFKHNIPIVYSIYDVFPGHAYDIGVIKSKAIYKLLQIIQKPCYKMASAITVLGEDMKTKVVEQGAKVSSVYVIPAWYDVTTIKEISNNDNKFIKKFGIPLDKFYIQFAGTIGYVFNYHTVIELADRLKNYDDIKIQIIGEGNTKNQFVNEATLRGLNNIIFYPLQPVELVRDVYSACNLCLIPLQKGVIGNGIPSKAPILMACRRIIVNSVEINSEYAKMFNRYNMGVAIDIDDIAKLADTILYLKNNPEEIKVMSDNAYDYCIRNYSSTLSINKLLDLFKQLVRDNPNENTNSRIYEN